MYFFVIANRMFFCHLTRTKADKRLLRSLAATVGERMIKNLKQANVTAEDTAFESNYGIFRNIRETGIFFA